MLTFLRCFAIASIIFFSQAVLAQVHVDHDTTVTFDSSGHNYKVSFTSRLPALQGRINDFENDLTANAIAILDSLCNAHEQKTSDQIVITTIPNYEPYSNLAEYATDLANKWGIGQKDKNNGVLIVFSNYKHQIRIATGLGLEKTLTDSICQKIINEVMIPCFKRQAFVEGLTKGVQAVVSILEHP
jgi:uncharacterized protein